MNDVCLRRRIGYGLLASSSPQIREISLSWEFRHQVQDILPSSVLCVDNLTYMEVLSDITGQFEAESNCKHLILRNYQPYNKRIVRMKGLGSNQGL